MDRISRLLPSATLITTLCFCQIHAHTPPAADAARPGTISWAPQDHQVPLLINSSMSSPKGTATRLVSGTVRPPHLPSPTRPPASPMALLISLRF